MSPYSEFVSLPSSSYLRYFATSSMKNRDRHLTPRSKSAFSFSKCERIVSRISTRRMSASDTSPVTSPA